MRNHKPLALAALLLAWTLPGAEVNNDQKMLLADEQLRLANGLESRGHHQMAIAEYQAIIKNFPKNPLAAEAWTRLAEAQAAAGLRQEALRSYLEFFRQFPASPTLAATKINYAKLLAESKGKADVDAAAKLLASLRADPALQEGLRSAAAFYLAGLWRGTGRRPQAADLYRELASGGVKAGPDLYKTYAALELGDLAREDGDNDGAAKIFQAVADAPGMDDALVSNALRLLAALRFERGDYEKAAETFGRLSVLFPDSKAGMEAKYSRLQSLYFAGKHDLVVSEADRLLSRPEGEVNLDRERLNFLRACSLRKQGFHAGALAAFKRILETSSNLEHYRQAAVQSVDCMAAVGKPQDVAAAAVKAITDPKLQDADRLAILAQAAKAFKTPDLSVPLWRDCALAAASPALKGKLLFELGADQERSGDFAGAIASYGQSLRLTQDPELKPYALMGTAACELKLGHSDAALTALDAVLALRPKSKFHSEALLRKAERLLRQNTPETARPLLLELKAANPRPPEWGKAVFYLGYLDYLKGDWAAAETGLHLALDAGKLSEPEQAEAKFYLGWALMEAGREPEAFDILSPLVSSPQAVARCGPEIICQLGELFLRAKRLDPAADCFNQVAAFKGVDKALLQRATLGLGDTAAALYDLKTAAARFRQAADLNSDPALTARALAKLGGALLAGGNKDEAVLVFEKALETPVDPQASALARLGLARILAERPERLATANRYAMSVFILANDPEICADAMLLSIEISLAQRKADDARNTWAELAKRFPKATASPKGRELEAKLKRLPGK